MTYEGGKGYFSITLEESVLNSMTNENGGFLFYCPEGYYGSGRITDGWQVGYENIDNPESPVEPV